MKRLFWIVVATLAAVAGGPAHAERVVITSTAPGVGAGTVLLVGQQLVVPDGATVTLIDHSGQPLVVRGPYSDVPEPAGQDDAGSDLLTAVAALLRDGGGYQGLGATRGTGASEQAPSSNGAPSAITFATIDVTADDVYCLSEGARPPLWRPDPEAAARFTVTDPSSGRESELHFVEGSEIAPWPDGLSTGGGWIEVVAEGDTATPVRITLHRVEPVDGLGPLEAVAALAALGCQKQAMQALDAWRESVSPFDLYLTTDRGRRPVYQVGDSMTLIAQASRDAFLYCFYKDSLGVVVSLFPTQYSAGAHVRGSVPLLLPGDRLPMKLELTQPRGQESVKCFASDRDLGFELPAAFVSGRGAPLAPELAAERDDIFAGLRRVTIVEAEVHLSIE